MSRRPLSRLGRLARWPQRDAQADDRRAYDLFLKYLHARMFFELGEAADPGPMPTTAAEWVARQPPPTVEEHEELLAEIRRMCGTEPIQ